MRMDLVSETISLVWHRQSCPTIVPSVADWRPTRRQRVLGRTSVQEWNCTRLPRCGRAVQIVWALPRYCEQVPILRIGTGQYAL